MSHRANRALRGFLLHDERITFDNLEANDGSSTGSSYTQTGGRPGFPVAADELGTYRPHAHHGQAEDLDVIALRPGIPGEAGLGYRADGEANTRYRGWSEPNLVMGYYPVEWTTTSDWTQVDAVTCPTSQKVVAVAIDFSGTANAMIWVWDPVTCTWGTGTQPIGDPEFVAITVLQGTGRLLIFAGSATTGAASVYYSDDDGTTWGEYAPDSMRPGTLNGNVDQVAMVQDRNGALCLIAVNNAGGYWQYVSDDAGVSWTEVETVVSIHDSASLSVLPGSIDPGGQILLTYNDGNQDARAKVLTDAYSLISAATSVQIDGTNNVITVKCALDADGGAYVVLSAFNTDVVKVAYSGDGGSTWSVYSERLLQLGGTVAGATGHQHLVRACAFSAGELVALFTGTHTGTPSTDGSLVSLRCGGWSTIEADDGDGRRIDRHSFGDPADVDGSGVFLPTQILDDQGWAHTGTAATLQTGYHRYNPTAATSYDTLTTAGHSAGDFTVLFEARVVTGGSVADASCSFYQERRTGAAQYILAIRMSTTQFRVMDGSGGGSGTALATIDLDMTTITQFALVWGSASALTVLYKKPSSSIWLEAVQATMGSNATALSTDVYEVGCRASTTSDMRVGPICFMNHAIRRGLTASGSVPALKWGKAVGPIPYPIRDQVDEDGRILHLSAGGGVARYRETWDLPTAWDYGVKNIHPIEVPKPTAVWRSENTSEQTLTWDLGDDSRLGHSWAIGLCLLRPNFRRAILEVSTSAAPTVFTQIGEYNSRVVVSSTFSRSGNLLEPGAAATPGLMYFGANWLRRGFVTLDPSGTPVNRRIAKNQGGGWLAGGMRTALQLEGITGSEPSTGNIHINISGGVLVVHLSAPTAFRRIRLRIPSQECPDSYYELGGIVLGTIWPIGRQWSRGWSWRSVPIIRTEEDAAGTIYVEPRTSDEDNPYRRELTVAWQDGYSAGALRMGAPPYLSAGPGTPALVADQDVWWQIEGLLRASKGGTIPTVALPEIPQHTSTIIDPTLWSYGRLGVGQSPQFNNVQGSEGRDELYRGEPLTHTELVG